MNLLILGGNSPHNQAWTEEIANTVGSLFEKTLVWKYKHWQTGIGDIDFEYEATQLAAAVKLFEPYVIFAKSVGVVLASQCLANQLLTSHGCIFIGTPLKMSKRQNLALGDWLRCNIKQQELIFVQNQYDPAGSAIELEQYLEEELISATKVVTLNGDTHSYTDLAELTKIASRFSA